MARALVAMSACALLTSFCSSTSERDQRPTACEFAAAQTLGAIVNSVKEEGSPTVSSDETELFFTSGRHGQEDLFVSMRPGAESPWSEPVNLGDSVNDSIGDDFSLRLAMNGLALYFASNRAGGFGAADLYVTIRDSLEDRWGRATNLGPIVNTAAFEAFPTPSPDGNTLYFNRSTSFDSQDSDIWITRRSDARSPWGAPQRLEMPVNGPRAEFSPSISADGLSLYFASDRDGNLGSTDIWVSTRKSAADAWGLPRNLGTSINAAGAMTLAPFITSNNRALYFMSARPDTSSASPCTPRTCFERLDLYVAVATCTRQERRKRRATFAERCRFPASSFVVPWPRIAALYDRLRVVAPSPVVDLNRAIAHSMAFGPEAGLRLVDEIANADALRDFAPLAGRVQHSRPRPR